MKCATLNWSFEMALSPHAARQRLEQMIAKSREAADGRWAHRYNGMWLTVFTGDDGKQEPIYTWGKSDGVVDRVAALQVLETWGRR